MEKNNSRLAPFLTVILTLMVGIIMGWTAAKQNWWGEVSKTEAVVTGFSEKDMGLFWEAWAELKRSYYEPDAIDQEKLVEGATMGMVSSLGDPYTMYLPPENNDRSGEDLAGVFYGIGVELGYIDGIVGVQAPLPGTPAEKAGLQAKDIFLHVVDEINGIDEDTTDWTTSKAQSVLRAKEKTPVRITLFRKDYNENVPFEVEIVRDEIKVDSIKLDFLNMVNGGKVAHLKVSTFGERTFEEWENAVKEILVDPEIEGIVLDLRNNPGGLFNEALHIASEFIADGVLVKQEGRRARDNRDYQASGKARLDKYPVVVLVNGGSASSSEIVAGALRDRKGAKLVGTKTFGKGLVQERVELKNKGGLHVTIAKWKLPNGDWIQKEGIPVDIEVKNDPDQPDKDLMLEKAIEVVRGQ